MSARHRPPGYARALRTDEQTLFDELTRASATPTGIQIEVGLINWPDSHLPQRDWLAVTLLPAGSSDADIYRARRRVLMQQRFFGLCRDCGQRCARGHMHSQHLCMGCAEQHHGMVY